MTTGKSLVGALVYLALTVVAAPAQTRITPEAFLSAVEGKTVDFHDFPSGDLIGTEEFLSKTLSVWRPVGRECVYGQITTPNGQVCFFYENDPDGQPACWWPYLHQGRFMVRLATFAYTEIQEVHRISDDGLNCPTPPIS